MTQIQDLERQLAKLKREQNFDLWKKWHSEGKNFLEKLVGRCFITQTHNDSFYMYKVISVKEQKVWGTKHDYGYFELLTEGHFHIRNAKHIYGSGIELPNDRGPYRTFTLIDKSKKGKVISDIDYNGISLNDSCNLNTSRVARYGRYTIDAKGEFDYNSYAILQEVPQRSISDEFNTMFTKEVPEHIYNDFKNFIEQQAVQIANLWEKHEKEINNLQRFKY